MKGVSKDRLFTIILTGLSGSGKSVALNALEDSGFFCVDNLPVKLIKAFVSLSQKTPAISKTAVVVDIRERKFLADFSDTVSDLRETSMIEVVFLESKDDILVRRFKETRRPHPLGYRDLKKAIQREAKLLQSIRLEADRIINTSSLSPHQLRNLITNSYSARKKKGMAITLISFGYKYGIPSEADLLFDVRFLPNPNFIKRLKDFPGTSKIVKNFVLSQQATGEFLGKLYPLLMHTIPLYKQEGRNYLTIGIGCTGGRHRSPAIVEEIRKRLAKEKMDVSVVHRDLTDLS
ncbi:MAG: RNase adapter RapZ [Nitrospirae bacterium]|nr:RNase adapter RapZ [Nitrospirota bacterium]